MIIIQWSPNVWPWMTMICYFTVNSGLRVTVKYLARWFSAVASGGLSWSPYRNTNEQLYFPFSYFIYTYLQNNTSTASWHRPVHCSAERPFCSASPQRLSAWPRPHALASMSATPINVTVHCAAQDMSLTGAAEGKAGRLPPGKILPPFCKFIISKEELIF